MSESDVAITVLLVCDALLKYTAALARGLADAGARVKLLSRDHGLEFGGDPDAMREYVGATLGDRVEHLILPGRVRHHAHWGRTLELRREISALAPDVIHYQESIVNDPRLLIAAPPRRRRFAFTIHDPVSRFVHREPLWQRRTKRMMIRRAGLIFTHAEALRLQLIHEQGVRAPVAVVPHGISLPQIRPLPETPTILAFGRIQPYKGLDVLFDAMPAVWEGLPECRLLVAGQGRLAEHPVLSDPRVEVRNDYLPESAVPDLFAAATCVALPYRQASQSGVGSLAKEHGRAMVASDVGGLRELVGDAGIMVPPADPPALAAALLELMRTPGLAGEMGRAGAASVEGSAGWLDVGRQTLEAYATYLGAPRISASRALS
ncbi:MAG TPA: glycosyltransferase family 4 protein [Solirubrobacterales bacterium]